MGAKSSSRRNYHTPYGYHHRHHAYNTYGHQPPPPQQLHPAGYYQPHSNSYQNSDTNFNRHHQISSQFSPSKKKKFQRTYSRIADKYRTLEEVTAALADAGLHSSNLIVGVDFTISNQWTGKRSFKRRCLHHIGKEMNPYQQALSVIGRSLSSFDKDNLIPCFGFGDASTGDQDVFSFYPDGHPCDGFEEALSRYREIAPDLELSGPTSFAPIIEMAITIVEESGGEHHVLLIIADGQVTRSTDTTRGHFSPQEQLTIDAIVRASEYPLSIVLVGVGDGPWDMMKEFDDHIPQRAFDNFQFVNFTEIMLKNTTRMQKEMKFALSALMEIPLQYRAIMELGILGRRTGRSPGRNALPTPNGTYHRTPPINDNQACPVCLTNKNDMAFGCGHQTCQHCGTILFECPICRRNIEQKIRLY